MEQPDYAAAAVFYLFYVGGVIWFVTVPAIEENAPAYAVLLQAGLLGGMAYGTYEFTNMATLKGWSWRMVLTDLSWGIFLTGTAAFAGYLAARRV